MSCPGDPAGSDADVRSPYWLLLEMFAVEPRVVEHQPPCDGDDGEGVDGGDHAEPQSSDDDLAANLMDVSLHTFDLSHDADNQKDPSNAVVAGQGEEHPVGSLSPERLVPEEEVAKERVGEDDEDRTNHNGSRPQWILGEPLSRFISLCQLRPPIEPPR